MTLPLPRHIDESGLILERAAFKWDDDDPWACDFEVPRLKSDLSAYFLTIS